MTQRKNKPKQMANSKELPISQTPEIQGRAVVEKDILNRGVVEIITKEGLEKRLREGKPLRVKYGIDPTMQSGHIGHAVPIRKLRQFQDLGHTAVFIIGDYTARIGDPTNKTATRQSLDEKEIEKNAKYYFEQAYKILDKDKTEIHLQSEWYKTFALEDLIKLMSKTSHGQLMSHETFEKRVKEEKSLAFHEMLYPVLQAYDSVAIKADVELGGADQRFNFVLTRDIQKMYGQRPEEVILTHYLPGINGEEKMSKSLSNTIDLLENAENMYAKVMSIPDNLMPIYFELATDIPLEQIKDFSEKLITREIHPMELKKTLAKSITSLYHDPEQVKNAEERFQTLIQKRQVPEDIKTIEVDSETVNLGDLLLKEGLVSSEKEAKRILGQRGIKINNEVIDQLIVTIDKTLIIKVGKRRFLKIVPKT